MSLRSVALDTLVVLLQLAYVAFAVGVAYATGARIVAAVNRLQFEP